MTSPPPPSNILLDPTTELAEAIRTNLFGIGPSSKVVLDGSFPLTQEDKEAVKAESRSTGRTSGRVVGKANIILLEGDELDVTLDQRGYTLESSSDTQSKTFLGQTYESLEALLIAVSPGYVQAMTAEVGKRFEGFVPAPQGKDGQEAQARDLDDIAREGNQEVWK